MHEAFWNGLFDVRWGEAPLGAEAIRLTVRLRERGDAERTCRDYGHAVVHLGGSCTKSWEVSRFVMRGSSLAAKAVSPHTLRHTTALHLLQSGVELNVIKSWLGHVSITTTSEYIEIDMAMKRKAIERCPPLVPDPEGESRWHASNDIIQWLEDL
jgi:integrase